MQRLTNDVSASLMISNGKRGMEREDETKQGPFFGVSIVS